MPNFGTINYLMEAKKQARKIGVDVEYSKNKNKKLDVFKNDKKVGSIGGDPSKYSDFIQHKDPNRRKLYKLRHEKYRNIKNTNSYFADKILW